MCVEFIRSVLVRAPIAHDLPVRIRAWLELALFFDLSERHTIRPTSQYHPKSRIATAAFQKQPDVQVWWGPF